MHAFQRCFKFAILWAVLLCSASSFAGRYQDWWWNPNQSGQGFNIGQQGEVIFASWFTYDNAGESMWVTLSGTLTNNVVSGDLNLFTGPKLGTAYDPSKVSSTKVGTARITFNSLSKAVVEWTLSGFSGSMNIERFTWNPLVYAGTYYSQCVGGSKCADGVPSYAVSTDVVVTFDGTTIRIADKISGGALCNFVGTVAGEGSIMRATGTYSCNTSAETGTWNSALSFSQSGSQTVLSRNDTMTRNRGGCTAIQTVVGVVTYR